MSEEDVDNHVLRKYSLIQKLGKGVSFATRAAAGDYSALKNSWDADYAMGLTKPN